MCESDGGRVGGGGGRCCRGWATPLRRRVSGARRPRPCWHRTWRRSKRLTRAAASKTSSAGTHPRTGEGRTTRGRRWRHCILSHRRHCLSPPPPPLQPQCLRGGRLWMLALRDAGEAAEEKRATATKRRRDPRRGELSVRMRHRNNRWQRLWKVPPDSPRTSSNYSVAAELLTAADALRLPSASPLCRCAPSIRSRCSTR